MMYLDKYVYEVGQIGLTIALVWFLQVDILIMSYL